MKTHINVFLSFLIGIVIGFSWITLYSLESSNSQDEGCELNYSGLAKVLNSVEKTVLVKKKRLRILCFLTTNPESHSKQAVHITKTWGKHCDKLIFASAKTDINIGAIGLRVTNDNDHNWGKVKLMMKYIYEHFLDDYDWFFKGDDVSFLMVENLRYLLSSYSTDDPIYFGHKFNTPNHKWGYFSGGKLFEKTKFKLIIIDCFR